MISSRCEPLLKDLTKEELLRRLKMLATKLSATTRSIKDSELIVHHMFARIFDLINENHSVEMKNHLTDILSSLIMEINNISIELLDLLLSNIVKPKKMQNRTACQLAKDIIFKTQDYLKPILKRYFDRIFVINHFEITSEIYDKICDLVYELYAISPTILYNVLQQMEYKLHSTNEQERLAMVKLLSNIFSAQGSKFNEQFPNLLYILLGCFDDGTAAIRITCVQYSMHYFINHSRLRPYIIKCLRARHLDSNATVRYEVVLAIAKAVNSRFDIVCETRDLLLILRKCTLDTIFKVRREALSGLVLIYQKASNEKKFSLSWIKNTVMHFYYMPTLDDRICLQRILITYLIPYQLNSKERMKRLCHLLATFDYNSSLAFVKLQKDHMNKRKIVRKWIMLHHLKEITIEIQDQLSVQQSLISKMLPDTMNATESLTRFSANLRKDPDLLRYMQIILKHDVSCKECVIATLLLLKKLDVPCNENLYYQVVKMLLEIVASVMIDKESISALVELIDACMQGGDAAKEMGIPGENAGIRGLKILNFLSFIFPVHFYTDKTLRHMMDLLRYRHDYIAPLILRSFTRLGQCKALSEIKPDIMFDLTRICKYFALHGTAEEAKHAVRCAYVNAQENALRIPGTPQVHPIFHEIVESLSSPLTSNDMHRRAKIITLGHIAYKMPHVFAIPIKKIISAFIVKNVLLCSVSEPRDCKLLGLNWCERDELPPDTICKLDALKTMARWSLGMATDEFTIQKTLRLLFAHVYVPGGFLERDYLLPVEKSWLRLGAACAILKICERKVIADQCTAEQYFNLSQVICDPELKVREMFAAKLHKGLAKELPNKCLPLDFMGHYVLGGYETDQDLVEKMSEFLKADINKRREYLKILTMQSSGNSTDLKRQQLLPDFMLTFVIPILAHHPSFTNYQDYAQLKQIEKALRFVLDPLISRPDDDFSFSFYERLIRMMKDHCLTTTNDHYDINNLKMWAICDIADFVIRSKMPLCKKLPNEKLFASIQLPIKYFKSHQHKVKGLFKLAGLKPEYTSPFTTVSLTTSKIIPVTVKVTVTGRKRARSSERCQASKEEIVNNKDKEEDDSKSLSTVGGRKRKRNTSI
ncbi:sister chromatid cohesion protein PDS5 homolog A-like [Glossina fuscipes fuscipes]